MAAWTEAERVKIRRYLGFSAIFTDSQPLLENAITSVLATADGGSRPNNATQVSIQAILTNLDELEAELKKLWKKAVATQVEDIKIDPARAMIVLRMEGRRLVTALSVSLGTTPCRDIFSSTNPDDPYSYDR